MASHTVTVKRAESSETADPTAVGEDKFESEPKKVEVERAGGLGERTGVRKVRR